MPDKSQNIVINYKFNTGEIDKANAILTRANQASNTLQGSGQKAGQVIGQSFSTAGRSIEAMNTQLARLKAQIQLSSDPRRVAELSNQYKVLKTQIDAANKSAFETPKAMKATQQATQSAAQGFGQLFTAAKLFITAGLAREALNITLSLAELKGNVEGVERAFARSFPNEIALLNRLRAATHGTITDFELMQRTLQATNLGVGVRELPQLFEFAAARAQQTGESVDYLVDSIVRGIGRKSALILDNLGISAIRLKEELGGVSLQAASVGQVTAAVGKIAQEELTKMGGYAETSATSVKQLNVAWEQLRITLAKKIESGGLISFLGNSVKGLEDLLKIVARGGFEEIDQEITKNIASVEALKVVEGETFKSFADDNEKKIGFLKDEIAVRENQVDEYNQLLAKEKERFLALTDTGKFITYAQQKEVEGIKETVVRQERKRESISETVKILKEYLAALKEVKTVEDEPSGIIERLKERIKGIQEAIEKTNDQADLGLKINIRVDDKGVEHADLVVGRLTKKLELAQAELSDLQRVFTDFKVEPFKIEMKTAENALTSFGTNIKRMEDSLSTLEKGSDSPFNIKLELSKPADTVAKLDTFWSELGDNFRDNWQSIVSDGIDIQADLINSALDADVSSLKNKLSVLKNYYDEQEILAGDNERKKKELRLKEERETAALQKRIFEKEKSTRRAQAVIDGSAGVIKAFATAPNFYVALIQAGLIAARTIGEINNINRQKSGYARGVIDLKGPGTGTSDSIQANLSRGESVMTAWETRHAGDVLKDIRAKKLDNNILRGLKQGRAAVSREIFDDKNIIKAIEKNKAPDVVKQSKIVYEISQVTETYHKKIRSKSINL